MPIRYASGRPTSTLDHDKPVQVATEFGGDEPVASPTASTTPGVNTGSPSRAIPFVPQSAADSASREGDGALRAVAASGHIKSAGIAPTKGPEYDLTRVNEQLAQLLTMKDSLTKLVLEQPNLTPPEIGAPSTRALDKLQAQGPQRMDAPAFPEYVQNTIIANSIQAVIADVLTGIVGGVTGEAMIAPLPSTGIMQQTAAFALDELGKYESLLEKIEFTNMELEREHKRDVIAQLSALDSRLDAHEQAAFTNYMNVFSQELQMKMNQFNADSTIARMNIDLEKAALDTELATADRVFKAKSAETDREARRREALYSGQTQVNIAAAKLGMARVQAMLSMQRSQRENKVKTLDPQKTAQKIADVTVAYGVPTIANQAQKGFDMKYNLQTTAAMDDLTSATAGQYSRLAARVYDGVIQRASDTIRGRELADQAEASTMQYLMTLNAVGQIATVEHLNRLSGWMIDRVSRTGQVPSLVDSGINKLAADDRYGAVGVFSPLVNEFRSDNAPNIDVSENSGIVNLVAYNLVELMGNRIETKTALNKKKTERLLNAETK